MTIYLNRLRKDIFRLRNFVADKYNIPCGGSISTIKWENPAIYLHVEDLRQVDELAVSRLASHLLMSGLEIDCVRNGNIFRIYINSVNIDEIITLLRIIL